ncbi:MAG: selenium-binding family protein [Actinomycetota bacterium]|jgi:selenium-binding protein 1|nr:selenium-binding family protein [Actinomycetota bacterium]
MTESEQETPATLYRTPREAMEAPAEKLAYVALLKPDAIVVIDVDSQSSSYGNEVGRWEPPAQDPPDEFHHYGWNICSSALGADHQHDGAMERRYLVVPGIRSSRIYVLDVGPDPRRPRLVKTIEPAEVMGEGGYSRPHTVHCGPGGLFVSALGSGSTDGEDGPAGIFTMDHDDFNVTGQWELDRGSQKYAYDFWWHVDEGVMITSEWAPPRLIENGIVPEALLNREYGHKIHFFDLEERRHITEIDLGDEHQMALEVRPAHDPTKTYGFLGVVINVTDLSASVWTWYKDGDQWKAEKTIHIPAVPADADTLPPLLKGFGAVPPVVTDIDLSLDDRFLYVACWGLGELHQYDVSEPLAPRLTGKIELGGILHHADHASGRPWAGAPQMVEVSRDGRRVYGTNSLYGAWDLQFYPEGVPGAMFKADVDVENGGFALDPEFHVEFPGHRAHQIRLEGGDCSTDSFCFV